MKTPKSFTETLIATGGLVAPVFYLLVVVQLLIRPEFDIRLLPVSFLSLGNLGWIQILNFIIAGALALTCAWGLRLLLRGEKGGSWGPALIGLFGIGMIISGLFPPDPIPGLSPGVDAGTPVTMSVSGGLHMAGFFLAFPSLIAACFVFTRRFISLRQRGWAIYSALTGIAVPVLNIASFMSPAWMGVIVAIAGLILFGWLAALAAQMVARPLHRSPAFA